MKICLVPGCTRPLKTRGMCNMHNHRWIRHGDVGTVNTLVSPHPWGPIANRRARQIEKNRGVVLTDADKWMIKLLLSDPCSYCGGAGGEIDHIDALGDSGWQNLTAACRSCNSSKDRLPILRHLLAAHWVRVRRWANEQVKAARAEFVDFNLRFGNDKLGIPRQ